jgi:hypothetical protein
MAMDPDSNLVIEIKEEESQEFHNDEAPPSPVSHLGLLFIATAGQNGSNLGCDEEEIVLLVLSVLKVSTNEVRSNRFIILCSKIVSLLFWVQRCGIIILCSKMVSLRSGFDSKQLRAKPDPPCS